MASEAEQSDYFEDALSNFAETPGEDEMDAALEARMAGDARLESGVPATQRHDDMGFIQFSGITRPDLADDDSPREDEVPHEDEAPHSDLDPTHPVSFYEPGVADVDAKMAPGGAEGGTGLDDHILPVRQEPAPPTDAAANSPSAEALKHIIEELTGPAETAAEAPQEEKAAAESVPAHTTEREEPKPVTGETVAEDIPRLPDASDIDALPLEEQDPIDLFASALAQEPNDVGAAPPTPVPDSEDTVNTALKARMAPQLSEAEQLLAALDATPQAEASLPSQETAETDTPAAAPAPAAAPVNDSDAWGEDVAIAPAKPEPVSTPLTHPSEDTTPPRQEFAGEAQITDATETAPEPVVAETPTSSIPSDTPETVATEETASPRAPEVHAPAEPVWQPEPVPASVLSGEDAAPETSGNQPLTEPRGTIQYSYSAAPSRRRSSRGGHHRRKAIRAAVMMAVAGALCLSAAAVVYYVVLPQMGPPEDAYERAVASWDAGDYASAASYFALFARRHPDHPNRAEAQFRAALAKQNAARTPVALQNRDTRDQLNQDAYDLFSAFVDDNPGHRKIPRAENLMGVLLVELEDYAGAISHLRDPARRVEDPDAALAGLRTLADAYSKLGQVEDAESTYLQAAVLPGNYTRDVDYVALGDLFSRRAEVETEAPLKDTYLQKAQEYWTLALALPAADPRAKKEVQTKLSLVEAVREQEEAITAEEVSEPLPAQETSLEPMAPEATAVVEVTDLAAPADTMEDAGETTTVDEVAAPVEETPVQEPAPMEEAAFLEGTT